MKKAFDQNVSRAKPRLRLGGGVETDASTAVVEGAEAPPPADGLSSEIKARLERARTVEAELAAAPGNGVSSEEHPQARPELPKQAPVELKSKRVEPEAKSETAGSAEARRERLKERLRAARENPRPEPLPATVAEAGALAVEKIASLQSEVSKLKALNLTLTQDLETARRNCEKATEEARIRMDEARRLTAEMDARAKLLAELERELASLEGERNEALLALQDARAAIEAGNQEKDSLRQEVSTRDRALADSLAEEERLAGELEEARDQAETLRRSLEALNTERDVLARQVGDLTSERAELLEARKALESVHRALTQASVR